MNAFIFLFGLGVPEWILIILAIVLLFGGRKIPELMRGIGQGIREFNNAKNDVQQHIREGMKEDEKNKGTEKKD
jgi:sec-independent protein translocase protein TatA